MSGATAAASGWHRLVAVYPRWYRERQGEEIVDTVITATSTAPRPRRLAEALSLLGHGLALRADLGVGGALGAVLDTAAAPGLAGAAVLSAVSFVAGDWQPWSPAAGAGGPVTTAGHFGPFATVGPVVYLAWVLAALVALCWRPGESRRLATLAVAVTALVVPASAAFGVARPPLFLLAALAGLGLPALLAPTPAGGLRQRPPLAALAGAFAPLALLAATAAPSALARFGSSSVPAAHSGFAYYQAGMAVLAGWVPLVAVVVIVAAALAALAGRRVLGGAGAVLLTPWLLVSALHASRASAAGVSAILLVVVISASAALGAAHQCLLTERHRLMGAGPGPQPA